jgi:hypothetical protein
MRASVRAWTTVRSEGSSESVRSTRRKAAAAVRSALSWMRREERDWTRPGKSSRASAWRRRCSVTTWRAISESAIPGGSETERGGRGAHGGTLGRGQSEELGEREDAARGKARGREKEDASKWRG